MEDNNNNNNIKNHILSFHGLRAIAVIFVTLYHLVPHIFAGGYLGVVIFLVMSGYLVTDNLLEEIDRSRYLEITKFWKRRIKKLYTPLIPMLIVTSFVLLVSNKMLDNYIWNLTSSLLGFNNIYQILQGLSYFDTYLNVNPFTHLWSLGLEIQFYLIWPIFISLAYNTFRIRRKKLAILTFVLAFISAFLMFRLYIPETDVSRVYYGLDTRAFSFLIGSAFGIILPRNSVIKIEVEGFKKYLINILSLIVISIIIYCLVMIDAKLNIVYNFGMFFFSILVGVFLVLILFNNNYISKILSRKEVTDIGKRSYSLYLWQYPVIVFINAIFKWTKLQQIYIVFIEFFIIIIISEISFRLFEEKLYFKYKEIYRLNFYVILLSSFIIFSTSISSISKDRSENSILKERISEIEKKSKEAEEKKKEVAEEKDTKNKIDIKTSNFTFIGDSVMLSAKDNLEKQFESSVIDAKISRQYWHLKDILTNLNNDKKIRDNVVIHLGTNSNINKSEYIKVLGTLKDKKIFLINCVVPRPWENQVNNTILEISKEMKNVKIIDWYSFSKDKKELFYDDGTHPNLKGSEEYAKFIKNEIFK